MPSTAACVTCGRRVFVDDRFCAGCGTPVAIQGAGSGPTTDDAVAGSTICSTCAGPVLPGDEFCPKCGTRSPDAPTIQSDVSVRRIIADRLAKATAGDFEIVRELGHGAMGAVYLARDLSLGRRVAIKLIAPAFLDNPTMVERFILEAQTVASLRHPNIVNIHSVREFADLHYFVMDFIDGPSLRKVLRDHGPLEIPVVQSLLFQVGTALSYAHRSGRGVIHRDVKPANIMLDREGNAFMTDFGISKIAQSKSGLTVTGTTVGTPDYMSPEQCRDEVLTGAADQYSLGIVAYEMLCGAPPFTGSHHVVMFAHTSDEPPPVAGLRADCPPEVADAVMRMLAKSPEDRWPDVGTAVEALGGRPLSHRDPLRESLHSLIDTDFVLSAGFDVGSPLSPIPGADSLDGMIPASVSISGLPALVEAGDSFTLRADAQGLAGAEIPEPDALWATSDPSIAMVDGGAVQALAPGPVSITATVGSVASTLILTVAEPSVARIAVIPGTVRTEPGTRIRLRADLEDRRGNRLERDVRWASDADAIVTVSGKGDVEAHAPGIATVTAEVDGILGNASITVKEAEARAIQLSQIPTLVVVGDEFSILASLVDARGVAIDREVTWESSDSGIATVEGGVVTAVAMGTVTVTASYEEQSAAVDVTILPQPVASIEISGIPESPRVGEEFSIVVSLTDARAVALDREVTWESSNAEIATVRGGVVRAVAAGTVTITATCDEQSAAVDVKILHQPVVSIAISGLPASTTAGDRFQLDTMPLDAEGRSVPSKVEWRSSDKSVASVSRAGMVHARKAGEIEIVASADSVNRTVHLVVQEIAVPTATAHSSARHRAWATAALLLPIIIVAAVAWSRWGPLVRPANSVLTTAVSVDPPYATIVLGESVRLVAVARDASGTSIAGRATIWSSDDTVVATVDTGGVVVARAAGISSIAVVIDGFEVLTTITVLPGAETIPEVVAEGPDPAPGEGPDRAAVEQPEVDATPPPAPRVASVSVTVPNTTMMEGMGQAVALRIFDSRSERLPLRNHAVSWRSTDTSVVSVNARGGTLTARAFGRAYVVATVDGVADSVLVSVDARVASVSISVSNTSMTEGTVQALALGVFDRRGARLQGQAYPASWRSTNPAVVSVSIREDSLAALSPGQAYVVATIDEARDSILVSVEALVAAVEIQGGNFTLTARSSTVLQAVVLGSSRQRLGNRQVRWVSSDPRVASVGSSTGRVTGNLPGTAQIAARSEGLEGRVTVVVESAAPEPPTTAEAQAEVERYLALLVAGDRDAVRALFGNAAEEEQHQQLLNLMGQSNFGAELLEVADVSTSDQAAVRFEVELSWRSFTGSTRRRPAAFRALLEKVGQGWLITSCAMVRQGEP